jgi:hypothetical protein
MDEISTKGKSSTVCNFRYAYWFGECILGYLDVTEPMELLLDSTTSI